MRCKECASKNIVKNGSKNGNPYYKCKECGKQFSEEVLDTDNIKRIAIGLYCYGLSLRTVGLLIGRSNVCVLNWIREFAKLNYSKPVPKSDIVLELDEMWHFVEQKKTNCGFGKHIVAQLENLLTGNAEIEIPQLLQGCIID